MILAIDTSADRCAVALLGDSGNYQRAEPMQRGHAEALFPMIDAVLRDAGVGLERISKIAVCTGPGSFTGLRVGIAAARGLSLGLKVPAVGITSFAALAAGHSLPATVRLPGRRGQIYCQSFQPGPTADGDPWIEDGAADDHIVDPLIVARLADGHNGSERPAPLYLRGADADLPSEAPPIILDA
ncbi:MAG: tRNA (adenosine(37)-N6)-threonylcarbamoyltransferase complex dimerization subunit type 1 TsaB [Pseudomonadota bacterium]